MSYYRKFHAFQQSTAINDRSRVFWKTEMFLNPSEEKNILILTIQSDGKRRQCNDRLKKEF